VRIVAWGLILALTFAALKMRSALREDMSVPCLFPPNNHSLGRCTWQYSRSRCRVSSASFSDCLSTLSQITTNTPVAAVRRRLKARYAVSPASRLATPRVQSLSVVQIESLRKRPSGACMWAYEGTIDERGNR